MNTNEIPKTVADARAMGYNINGYATAYQRGYVSRRANIDDRPICVAGGTRKGELYYTVTSPASTQYCIRVYIGK